MISTDHSPTAPASVPVEPGPALTFRWEPDSPRRLVVGGEIDLATHRRFGAELARGCQDRSPFIVDLCGVDFIGSCGISWLYRYRDDIAAVLTTDRTVTSRALEHSGINRRIPLIRLPAVHDERYDDAA